MNWVLLVSLGPVQDFIVTARKCQDLWYGSWLLSELARATASALEGALGPAALVFPSGIVGGGASHEGPREVANKILVEVEGDAERVREVAMEARRAMDACLQARVAEVFATVGRGDERRETHFKETEARSQVAELIEFYWAAAPLSAGGYARAREEAERLLAARKNTRDWKQPAWRSAAPKSSLDGVRESVIDEEVYDGVAPAQRLTWYGTDRAERLSGIDVLKRKGFDHLQALTHGPDWNRWRGRHRFASTQHLASLPWLVQADRDAEKHPAVASAWSAFCSALDEIVPGLLERYEVAPEREGGWCFGQIDGGLLQERALADAVGESVPGPEKADRQRRAETARKAFFEAVRSATGKSPPRELQPYYAVLLADGDRMGTVIDAARLKKEHQAISGALAGFAERVGDIVREHHGSLVYAGGDDVLALLPIHTALDCAAALHAAFGAAMGAFRDQTGASPTLSAGLIFAHQKTPLFETLKGVREAEKAAKALKGKDSLALWVDKRGGERVEISGRFDDVVGDLKRLVDYLRRDLIPGRAAYELETLEALRMDPLPDGAGRPEDVLEGARVREAMKGVQAAEIKRVLGRRWSERGARKMPEEVGIWLDALSKRIAEVDGNPARGLALRLRGAEAIARGHDEAALPLPSETTEEPVE